MDAWSFDNPDSDIPAMTNVMTNNEQRMSTYYIEDGSYLKLRNIELGYTFPAKINQQDDDEKFESICFCKKRIYF